MFESCIALLQTPDLPATTLVNGCYDHMFCGCSCLTIVKIYYIDNFKQSYFAQWVDNVANYGTFYYNCSQQTTAQEFGFPTSWEIKSF